MKWFGLVYFLIMPPVFAATVQLPASLEKSMQSGFADWDVVKAQKCKIGSSNLEAFGMIGQYRKGTIEKSPFPLKPMVAVKIKNKWIIQELSLGMDYEKGSVKNFLADFLDKDKKLEKYYEIRCALPLTDKEISLKASGKPTVAFQQLSTHGQHLCFQADGTYNSWTCFNMAPNSGRVENSFNQLNAD